MIKNRYTAVFEIKLVRIITEDVLIPINTSPNNMGAEQPHPVIIPPNMAIIVPIDIPEYWDLLFIVLIIEYIDTVISNADTIDKMYIMYNGTFNKSIFSF